MIETLQIHQNPFEFTGHQFHKLKSFTDSIATLASLQLQSQWTVFLLSSIFESSSVFKFIISWRITSWPPRALASVLSQLWSMLTPAGLASLLHPGNDIFVATYLSPKQEHDTLVENVFFVW